MELLTQSGKRPNGLNISYIIALLPFLFATSVSAQTVPLTCITSSTNLVVHSEGITEPVGSLLLTCSGGAPGTVLNANLTATYPAVITNRINLNGTPDISLTVDTGSGPVPTSAVPVLGLQNVVSFNGINLAIPASRAFSVAISNVRLNLSNFGVRSPVVASISSTVFSITNATATVASATPSLLSNAATTSITCVGSPIPSVLSVQNLFAAGTRFTSTRLTEGFGNAFLAKDATSDTGTRFLINYSRFPANARVFIPDYVAGNSATQPTAGGDLGGIQSGGVYTRTAAASLLLARVVGADANGVGGTPTGVASQFVGSTALGTVSEVSLTSGSGMAVYEVIDANNVAQESVQFPNFAVLPVSSNLVVATATAAVTIAPISTAIAANTTDPIPRFKQTTPGNDCSFIGDCNANYFPILSVTSAPSPIVFRSPSQGLIQTSFIQVNNVNAIGSSLIFSVNVTYQNGSGWIFVDPISGSGNTTLRVRLSSAGLAAGTYNATISVSAGAAGSSTIPVQMIVEAPVVQVTSVTNAATFLAGPLVAGSLGTIKGTNLDGTNVAVTFDGIPATILYKSATQINFQVPQSLGAKTTAQLLVMVDGVTSTQQPVTLAAAAPGIFGLLNQNGTINSATAPANSGDILQVFLTGLVSTGFTVTANLPGFPNLMPLYAGPAPGIAGVQQVNVMLPTAITGPVNLTICDTNASLNTCSQSFAITVR